MIVRPASAQTLQVNTSKLTPRATNIQNYLHCVCKRNDTSIGTCRTTTFLRTATSFCVCGVAGELAREGPSATCPKVCTLPKLSSVRDENKRSDRIKTTKLIFCGIRDGPGQDWTTPSVQLPPLVEYGTILCDMVAHPSIR
jgi:hypothetical protein